MDVPFGRLLPSTLFISRRIAILAYFACEKERVTGK
jgi:hypothetical protein